MSKTDFTPIVEQILKEFYVNHETAIEIMIRNLTERGCALPFSNPEEFRKYSEQAAQEKREEEEARQQEAKFIESLKYRPFTIQAKREIFRINMNSLISEYGRKEEDAFERASSVTPGVFLSLSEFNKYVTSLRNYIPEKDPRGAMRF